MAWGQEYRGGTWKWALIAAGMELSAFFFRAWIEAGMGVHPAMQVFSVRSSRLAICGGGGRERERVGGQQPGNSCRL
eukprot:3438311-Prorocentrum_lima.AAC.1